MSNAAPDLATSIGLIQARAFAPAYFAKLAEHGYVPRNRAEMDKYLKLADGMMSLHQEEQVKLASTHSNLLDSALADVDRVLGHAQAPADNDRAVKAAAAELANDPELVAAALVLQAAYAQASA